MGRRLDNAVEQEAIRQSDALDARGIAAINPLRERLKYEHLLAKGVQHSHNLEQSNSKRLIGKYSCFTPKGGGSSSAKSALLRLCVLWDLPITFDDIRFIQYRLRFLRVPSECKAYILAESDRSRDLVHRLGLIAAVPAGEEWGSPKPVDRGLDFFVRKHGRISAKVSEAAPKKSKQELISEAKAATLMYYAGMAREAQQTYMRKFNTLTEQ